MFSAFTISHAGTKRIE